MDLEVFDFDLGFEGFVTDKSKTSVWSDDEILAANLEDHYIAAECRGEGLDEGMRAIGDIANVVAVTKKIIKADFEIFKIAAWRANLPLKLNATALSVISGIRIDFARIDRLFACNDLNPYFKLFKECVDSLDWRLVAIYDLKQPFSQDEWAEWAVKLNEFADSIRRSAKQQQFLKLIQNYARGVNKNQASLNRRIDKIFERKSKVLVIRLDFTYGQNYGLPITYEEAVGHRKTLLNDVQQRLYKESYIGYVWKLEYGLMSSLHYHVLIFLDAQKVRSDILIARAIGEHWQNKVTQGRGRYWNCNARKIGYRKCGIGVVSHSDQILRNNLKMAASYLIKALNS